MSDGTYKLIDSSICSIHMDGAQVIRNMIITEVMVDWLSLGSHPVQRFTAKCCYSDSDSDVFNRLLSGGFCHKSNKGKLITGDSKYDIYMENYEIIPYHISYQSLEGNNNFIPPANVEIVISGIILNDATNISQDTNKRRKQEFIDSRFDILDL